MPTRKQELRIYGTILLLASIFFLITSFKTQNMDNEQNTGPAYCIFDNVQINNSTKLEEYKNNVFSVVEKFEGKYVIAGGQMEVIEGNWNPHFIVMIKFSSYSQAKKWYNSPEYRDLKKLRQSSGEFDAIIVEGL